MLLENKSWRLATTILCNIVLSETDVNCLHITPSLLFSLLCAHFLGGNNVHRPKYQVMVLLQLERTKFLTNEIYNEILCPIERSQICLGCPFLFHCSTLILDWVS